MPLGKVMTKDVHRRNGNRLLRPDIRLNYLGLVIAFLFVPSIGMDAGGEEPCDIRSMHRAV